MVKFIVDKITNKKVDKMKCQDNLVVCFISQYFPKNNQEYQEMKQHIITCEKCFKELIRLAPKYDPNIEE